MLSGGGSGIGSISLRPGHDIDDFTLASPSGIKWTLQPITFLGSIIENGPTGIKTSELSKNLGYDPRSSYFFARRLESTNLIESESIKSQTSNLLRAKRFTEKSFKAISSIISSGIDTESVLNSIGELSSKAGGAVCSLDIVSNLWFQRLEPLSKIDLEESPTPEFSASVQIIIDKLVTEGTRIRNVLAILKGSSTQISCYQPIPEVTNEPIASTANLEDNEITNIDQWKDKSFSVLPGIPLRVIIFEILRRLGPRGAIISELCSLLNIRSKSVVSLLEPFISSKSPSSIFYSHSKSFIDCVTEHCGRSRRMRYFYKGPSDKPLSVKWLSAVNIPKTENKVPCDITENSTKIIPANNKRVLSQTRLKRENIILSWLSEEKVLSITREFVKRLQEMENLSQYTIDLRSVIRIAHSFAARNLAKTISLKVLNSEQKILLLVALELESTSCPLHENPIILKVIEREKVRISTPRVHQPLSQGSRSLIKIERLFDGNRSEEVKKEDILQDLVSFDLGYLKSPIRRLFIFHSFLFRLSSQSNTMIIPDPMKNKTFLECIDSMFLWEFLSLFFLPRSLRLAKYLGYLNDDSLSAIEVERRLNMKISNLPLWLKSFLLDKKKLSDEIANPIEPGLDLNSPVNTNMDLRNSIDTDIASNVSIETSININGSILADIEYPIRKKWLSYMTSLAELGLIYSSGNTDLFDSEETIRSKEQADNEPLIFYSNSHIPVIGIEGVSTLPILKLAIKSPSGIDLSTMDLLEEFWASLELNVIIFCSSKKPALNNNHLNEVGGDFTPQNLDSDPPLATLINASEPNLECSNANSRNEFLNSNLSHYLSEFFPSHFSDSISEAVISLKNLSLSFYRPIYVLFRLNQRLKPYRLIAETFNLDIALPKSFILSSFNQWLLTNPPLLEIYLNLISISSNHRIPLSIVFLDEKLTLTKPDSDPSISSQLLRTFESLRIITLVLFLWFLFPPQMASSIFCIINESKQHIELESILSVLLADENGHISDENIMIVFSYIFPALRYEILGRCQRKNLAISHIKALIRSLFELIQFNSDIPVIKQASVCIFDVTDSIALDLLLPGASTSTLPKNIEGKFTNLCLINPISSLVNDRFNSCQNSIPKHSLISNNSSFSNLMFSSMNSSLSSASSSVRRKLIMYTQISTEPIQMVKQSTNENDTIEADIDGDYDSIDCCNSDDVKKNSSHLNQVTFLDFEPDEQFIGVKANLDLYSDFIFISEEGKFASSFCSSSNHSALVCQTALKSVVAAGYFFPRNTTSIDSDNNEDIESSPDVENEFTIPIESLSSIFGSSSSKLFRPSQLLVQIALGLKRDGIFTKKFYSGTESTILSSRLRRACCGLSLSFTDRYNLK